jgi:hypothetical protein
MDQDLLLGVIGAMRDEMGTRPDWEQDYDVRWIWWTYCLRHEKRHGREFVPDVDPRWWRRAGLRMSPETQDPARHPLFAELVLSWPVNVVGYGQTTRPRTDERPLREIYEDYQRKRESGIAADPDWITTQFRRCVRHTLLTRERDFARRMRAHGIWRERFSRGELAARATTMTTLPRFGVRVTTAVGSEVDFDAAAPLMDRPLISEAMEAMRHEQQHCPRWDTTYGPQWVWSYYCGRHWETYDAPFAPTVDPKWKGAHERA